MKHKNDDTSIYRLYNAYKTGKRQLYLITICKHQVKDFVSRPELLGIARQLSKEFVTVKHLTCERHGKYKQLHAHGCAMLPAHARYSLYTKCDSFRVHYRKMPSYKQTLKYIYKHHSPYNNTQHDTDMANYYAHHYGFKKWSKKE